MFGSMRARFGVSVAILAAATLSACSAVDPVTLVDADYTAERLVIRDFIGTLTIETAAPGSELSLRVDATAS